MPKPPQSPAATSKRPSAKPPARAAELALARKLLAAEAAAITSVSDSLASPFHAAVSIITSCADAGGSVLVAGLGKSGLIGQKISATLASLAIPSHFVHPAEAAHGDLGRFNRHDACILLSYSGETSEVVNLAALLRQDQIPLIAICKGTPGRKSSLERLCSVVLAIGPCDDPDLTPAPTCSTTATLALGDCLALCASRRRRFTDTDFAKRHPGGSLGEMLRPITDILRFVVGKNLDPVRDTLTVRAALKAADASGVRRPGALLLIDKSGKLTGIFTDADLRRLIERSDKELDRPIRDLMTRSPTVLTQSALVRDAVQLIREHRRDEVPVVDSRGRPVGILDVQDLVALKLIQSE